jgi:hypothetical protein
MASKFKKRVIICPQRKREVELTYEVLGNWFAPEYNVLACPAMYDGTGGCDRQCQSLLARPSSFERFVSSRI